MMLVAVTFFCVGHDTNLAASTPVVGIYHQAKRTTTRCVSNGKDGGNHTARLLSLRTETWY